MNKSLISQFLIYSFSQMQQQKFKQPIFGLHISTVKVILYSENYH